MKKKSEIAKEIVEEYRPEEDFWKSDTEKNYMIATLMMLAYGMEEEDIHIVMGSLIESTKAEYGD